MIRATKEPDTQMQAPRAPVGLCFPQALAMLSSSPLLPGYLLLLWKWFSSFGCF